MSDYVHTGRRSRVLPDSAALEQRLMFGACYVLFLVRAVVTRAMPWRSTYAFCAPMAMIRVSPVSRPVTAESSRPEARARGRTRGRGGRRGSGRDAGSLASGWRRFRSCRSLINRSMGC